MGKFILVWVVGEVDIKPMNKKAKYTAEDLGDSPTAKRMKESVARMKKYA